jgi:hypothetical protein
VAAPPFSAADARALHIRNELGGAGARARFGFTAAVRLAATQLNGTVVLPGADFSYRSAVGTLTAPTVLSPLGKATETAAERAHMLITERPGSLLIGRDLRFRNRTDYPVYVRAFTNRLRHGAMSVAVQIWGTAPRH